MLIRILPLDNALAAYSKVVQTLPRASDKDIDTYRTWMKENSPIGIAESRFLDHGEDLVSLTPGRAAHSTPVYSAIIIASAAILLPLLTFSMIAEFSGRLLVVALVGGAASIIATSYSAGAEHLVESRDGWRSAMLYVLPSVFGGFSLPLFRLLPRSFPFLQGLTLLPK